MKTILSFFLALGLIVPTQAAALNEDDAAALLFGLITGIIINEALKNDDTIIRPQPRPQGRSSGSVDAPGPSSGKGWSPQTPDWRQLPNTCHIQVQTNYGIRPLYPTACLQAFQVNALPSACSIRLYTRSGSMDGYDPICLHQRGYSRDMSR